MLAKGSQWPSCRAADDVDVEKRPPTEISREALEERGRETTARGINERPRFLSCQVSQDDSLCAPVTFFISLGRIYSLCLVVAATAAATCCYWVLGLLLLLLLL